MAKSTSILQAVMISCTLVGCAGPDIIRSSGPTFESVQGISSAHFEPVGA